MPKKEIRPIRACGQYAYVELTKGLEAIIDIEDADSVGLFNWHAQVHASHQYATRWVVTDDGKTLLGMHRFILNAPSGMVVDHINGNGLDNRRCNIRLASRSQNMHNSKMQCNNTSGFKGVHWDKNKRKWQANIKLHDKRRYLGSFDTAEDAAKAYQKAADKMHLDFARMK
jgi:hypothetical protein